MKTERAIFLIQQVLKNGGFIKIFERQNEKEIPVPSPGEKSFEFFGGSIQSWHEIVNSNHPFQQLQHIYKMIIT